MTDFQIGKVVFGPGFKDMDRFLVGFDDTFNKLSKWHDDLAKNIPNYPPYNIKKVNDHKYVIEIAVAGFSKSEIEIQFVDDKLYIKGNAEEDNETLEWLHKGIAARSFTRTFVLNDQVEIKNAALLNGMLQIALERIIPEHKKPKKIEISDEPSSVSEYASKNKQLLMEDKDVE
jgi:molecular chaperone IbpA